MFRKERYYEPADNDDGDKVDFRVQELMNDEYSISKNYGNFSEGISEAKKEDQEIILEMLRKPHADINFEALGRKLWSMSYEYMESCAESHAVDNLLSGYLS